MPIKGDKIFILLNYSPHNMTFERKFGNLPIKYIRSRITKEEEYSIPEIIHRVTDGGRRNGK